MRNRAASPRKEKEYFYAEGLTRVGAGTKPAPTVAYFASTALA